MNRCINIELNDFLNTIEKLSFDKNGEKISLCKFKNKFYDFEKIVKLKKSKELPKAVDMLYINHQYKEVWFIEFKNVEIENIKANEKKYNKYTYDVKRKILDSLITFYELFDKNLCCNYKKKYFVVYKCKDDDIHQMLYDEFIDREIYFSLKEIKNKFLEEVITDCCEMFIEEFEKRFNIKWEGE